ncbi:hypothetical protein ACH43Y_28910 [Streptomyces rubiginosohelvolus]|uniref:hypothetical protein n=1 Tax=Streptomyces rubiginosohelvolus TaxID=67362 RepID=UPI003796BEB0
MSAPMTPDREQEIRAREQAATPGPWMREDDQERLERVVTNESGTLDINFGYLGNNNQANVAFVVDARSAVPELLAEVDRLRARVAELEAARTKAAADRDAQVIAWLVKKAGKYRGLPRYRQEDTGDVIARLADKLSRGAVRPACPPVSPEDPHDSPLHHSYALGRDLPEVTPDPSRDESVAKLRALLGRQTGGAL